MKLLVPLLLALVAAVALGAGYLGSDRAAADLADLADRPVVVGRGTPLVELGRAPESAPQPEAVADGLALATLDGESENGESPDGNGDEARVEFVPNPGRHTSTHSSGKASGDGLGEGVEPIAFEDLVLPTYRPRAVLDDEVAREGDDLFPAEILALDGLTVALEGFMMPLDYMADRVSQFVLSPYPPGCCFGGLPGMDEWVDVEVLDGEGCEYFAYRTIRVVGTFEVGEVLDDYGYVSSIYRLRATSVERLW